MSVFLYGIDKLRFRRRPSTYVRLIMPAELVKRTLGAGSMCEVNDMSTILRSPCSCFSNDLTVRLKSTFQARTNSTLMSKHAQLGQSYRCG